MTRRGFLAATATVLGAIGLGKLLPNAPKSEAVKAVTANDGVMIKFPGYGQSVVTEIRRFYNCGSETMKVEHPLKEMPLVILMPGQCAQLETRNLGGDWRDHKLTIWDKAPDRSWKRVA